MNRSKSVTQSHPKHLCNQLDRERLAEELAAEPFDRKTISFYRYVAIDNPDALRDELYLRWTELGVRGRIYLATEGVNAQASIPLPNYEAFLDSLEGYFPNMPIKEAREEQDVSFLKLIAHPNFLTARWPRNAIIRSTIASPSAYTIR